MAGIIFTRETDILQVFAKILIELGLKWGKFVYFVLISHKNSVWVK